MADEPFRFNDGAAYERMMGVWSRIAGGVFLDWVSPASGLSWVDVGCGNGAFTELVIERCAPTEIRGVDPSDGQLAFARTRPGARSATFTKGEAVPLPFGDNSFDCAVMALVIFFVPDPAKGVAEMARVVKPGGTVCAYAWDMVGGGFPLEPIMSQLRQMDIAVPRPPSSDASRLEAMNELWHGAGLDAVETRQITVQRTFADFEDYWTTGMLGASVGSRVAAMASDEVERLKSAVRDALPPSQDGRLTVSARANAVKGVVPH